MKTGHAGCGHGYSAPGRTAPRAGATARAMQALLLLVALSSPGCAHWASNASGVIDDAAASVLTRAPHAAGAAVDEALRALSGDDGAGTLPALARATGEQLGAGLQQSLADGATLDDRLAEITQRVASAAAEGALEGMSGPEREAAVRQLVELWTTEVTAAFASDLGPALSAATANAVEAAASTMVASLAAAATQEAVRLTAETFRTEMSKAVDDAVAKVGDEAVTIVEVVSTQMNNQVQSWREDVTDQAETWTLRMVGVLAGVIGLVLLLLGYVNHRRSTAERAVQALKADLSDSAQALARLAHVVDDLANASGLVRAADAQLVASVADLLERTMRAELDRFGATTSARPLPRLLAADARLSGWRVRPLNDGPVSVAAWLAARAGSDHTRRSNDGGNDARAADA